MLHNRMTDRALVVGVDGSPSAALAVAWGVDAARRHDSGLRLVVAYQDHPLADAVRERVGQNPAEELTSWAVALERLETAAANARRLGPDLVVETSAMAGPATSVLLRASESAAAIVVGCRRLGPIHRVVTTSVSGTLAASASCPVVVVRASPSRSIGDTRVVVGVAGPESASALELAFDEAARFGAGLTAVHVPCTGTRDQTMSTADHHDHMAEDGHAMLRHMLHPLRSAYPNVDVRSNVVQGSAASRLVTLSENARLLVLGARTSGSSSVPALGRVQREVLRRSHCPVAVAHVSPVGAGLPGHLSDHTARKARR
jgi:nucleotide-binding universal stress UspA family protein